MRKVHILDLKPGMKLARDIFLDDGTLLLLAGFKVKRQYIKKLAMFNISYIYVTDDNESHPEVNCEEKVYSEAFKTIKSVLSSVREGKDFDVYTVKDTVDDIVHHVINNESVFMQISGIRDIDNYTFLHSLDVCIYSLITGKHMRLSASELTQLGIGAVLHDIGKCKIPSEILLKPTKLSDEEFEIMRLHAVYGHNIISNTPGLNKRIATIASQHHEKWDGTGYPLGLRGYQIDKFSRIVTIADIYDALTADRVYRKRELPHCAADYLVKNSKVFFDPDIVNIFIKNISVYPEGTILILNTGEIGKVIETDKNHSIRPRVRVIASKDGPPVLTPYVIDLKDTPQISILDILG